MRKLFSFLLIFTLVLSLSACGAAEAGEASVQSVAMLCGKGAVGLQERFSGVVSARSETELKKDENKVIDEILVSEGDTVEEGQLLFTYDAEQGQLTLEKAELELEQLKAALTSKETELAKLQKEEEKAKDADKLSYTLAIRECETAIREAEYNIGLKEKELERTKASLENMEVCAPVSGKVTQLNPDGGYDSSGNALCFLKLMETGTYRVKGTVNENNVGAISEGTEVTIRSRVDNTATWSGYISMIDWENPVTGQSSYYYYDSDTENSSSNYPFYVELEDAEGLLLGQHVYIELGTGDAEDGDGLQLPEYYLVMDGDSAWVWAENTRGKLEKRTVTLGTYDEEACTWEILSGLTEEDYIAYPEDTLKAGMACTEYDESAFSTEDYEGGYAYEDDYAYEGDYAYEDDYAYEGDYVYEEGYGDGATAMFSTETAVEE